MASRLGDPYRDVDKAPDGNAHRDREPEDKTARVWEAVTETFAESTPWGQSQDRDGYSP